MIAQLTSDLISKLDSVPGLTGKVGLATGGRDKDPALSKIPLPCAWAFSESCKPTDSASLSATSSQSVQMVFVVFLIVPYTSQEDLLTVQYPLLESSIKAVRGTQIPLQSKWRFEGYGVRHINPDRIFYELRFSANSHL